MVQAVWLILCFLFIFAALLVFLKREKIKNRKGKQHLATWYMRVGVALSILGTVAGCITVVVTLSGPTDLQKYTYQDVEFDMPAGWYQNNEDATGAYFKNDKASSGTTKLTISATPLDQDVSGMSDSDLATMVENRLKEDWPDQDGRKVTVGADYASRNDLAVVNASVTEDDETYAIASFICKGKYYTVVYSHVNSETVAQPLTTVINSVHTIA